MEQSAPVSTRSKPIPPTSPGAKELLAIILEHPVLEERGLTEVISSSARPNETMYIPNSTQSGGGAMVVKKSPLRAAVAELVQLGWLLSPEEDDTYRIYELNPDASV